ncbi:MAG TPA: sensor histidine kinase [Sporosarcina psychrophila]|uniref:histidine kinase n=1 Tax=Sporosarcina psychrophila TaxID=1476 RepID=A0A921G2R4_SPOPS|nr:sensor histidine kinase [Sporosarcina psychrophila]
MGRRFAIFPERLGKEPYTILIYMLFPFLGAFFLEGMERMITLILLVLFLFVYRQSYWRDYYLMFVIIQAIIIGYWVYMFGPMFFWLGTYSSNMISLLSGRKRGVSIGVYVLVGIAYSASSDFNNLQTTMSLVPILLIVINAYSILSRRKWDESQQELKEAHTRIDELVKQQERQRIGRDLHDTLGQKLSMITLKTELAEKLLNSNHERVAVELREVITISRETLTQMRELVEDLDTGTLIDELTASRQHLHSAGIESEVNGEILAIHRVYEKIAVMAIRELVTNVVKHSTASWCRIDVARSAEGVLIDVADDGKGVDDAIPSHGMSGLQGRLGLINGIIRWESGEGGTVVHLFIPLPQSAEKVGVVT